MPFVAEVYCTDFTHVFWSDDPDQLIDQICCFFDTLDTGNKWIGYAHNGGKFDWLFFVKKLRGYVSFKGRALMSAKIGPVEIRDSMHILPAGLANYKKKKFDYSLLLKRNRNKPENKPIILDYLHSDCVYLYDLVKHFTDNHGFKLSIGQAAIGLLKNDYKIECLSEHADAYLREYFFGGRVECLQGPGIFNGQYALDDINSSYPFALANYEHPVSAAYTVRSNKWGGKVYPNPQTVFLELKCVNFGALGARDQDGTLTFNKPAGIFKTTIWEYETARRLNLIRDVQILKCIDFPIRTNFSRVVVPLYDERLRLKDLLDNKDHPDFDELSRQDLDRKFLLNNMWGKFAQNSRDFCDYFYSDWSEKPPGECIGPFKFRDEDEGIWTLDSSVDGEFIVWKKPVQIHRFLNVATGASVTGAARARLLERIATSDDPVYCDTDCVISRATGDIEKSNVLGAWKREADISRCVIAGKKLYGYRGTKEKIRCKGAQDLFWDELEAVASGITVEKSAKAPKISKTGHQSYMDRNISLTCPRDYRSRIFEGLGK